MGKMMDKFLDVMRLNDPDDYEDEFYDDDEYEEEVKPVRKQSLKNETVNTESVRDNRVNRPKPVKTTSKVIPMRSNRNGMEVCVIKPSTVEDAREITDTLLSGRAVVLNLEGLQVEVAQRIIDFTSGSCYSINGNLQKITSYIFIITPESVDISGDFQEILNGGFDVSAFRPGI